MKQRITILGAGFAGLETAFLLRMRLRDKADLTVVAPQESFTFRPNTIYVPFGGDPDDLVVDLSKPFRRRHVEFVQGSVADVHAADHEVELADGRRLEYDKLVVATGADMRPEEIPGLAEHAATIWTPRSMLGVRERFERVRDEARDGGTSRVLFLVPPNNKCAGPLYEIVMMFETWLRRQDVRERVDITWSTFEQTYIQAFGPRLHEVVTDEFATRGITGHTADVVTEVVPGEARYADGTSRPFDHLIAFPPYVSAVRYAGLPSDDRGFIRTEMTTREVAGVPDVYAPGDAGDFPVKQAFLAFLQADTVAEHVAALAGMHPFEQPFDPVSMCIMEMFDKATFAQVPLEVTGDPARPVKVRDDADGDYKVGTGTTWRLGKKMLGMSVPMRFHAGEPFHAGMGWQMMEVGLKGMSSVLAD
ncbi:MAG: FAD-dependent oxidoreductase [Solirubrobacterales bacterium]|nr:FAD-dependent oxidoreductase [Solirubrobacterales bacterium]